MKYETVEIPFEDWNGFQVITDRDYVDKPYVKDFVDRFKHLFQHHELLNVWVYFPTGCIRSDRRLT
jgi:hypothetical protein